MIKAHRPDIMRVAHIMYRKTEIIALANFKTLKSQKKCR